MTDHVIILLRSKIKSNEKNWSDKKEEEKREIELFHSGVVATTTGKLLNNNKSEQ